MYILLLDYFLKGSLDGSFYSREISLGQLSVGQRIIAFHIIRETLDESLYVLVIHQRISLFCCESQHHRSLLMVLGKVDRDKRLSEHRIGYGQTVLHSHIVHEIGISSHNLLSILGNLDDTNHLTFGIDNRTSISTLIDIRREEIIGILLHKRLHALHIALVYLGLVDRILQYPYLFTLLAGCSCYRSRLCVAIHLKLADIVQLVGTDQRTYYRLLAIGIDYHRTVGTHKRLPRTYRFALISHKHAMG